MKKEEDLMNIQNRIFITITVNNYHKTKIEIIKIFQNSCKLGIKKTKLQIKIKIDWIFHQFSLLLDLLNQKNKALHAIKWTVPISQREKLKKREKLGSLRIFWTNFLQLRIEA